jgi:hypothetical protein
MLTLCKTSVWEMLKADTIIKQIVTLKQPTIEQETIAAFTVFDLKIIFNMNFYY